MGDCRIQIIIAKDLLLKENQNSILSKIAFHNDVTISETKTSICWSRVFSADTTIREVAEGTPDLWLLYTSSLNNLPFQLWDCTIHPPKDISDWPTELFPEQTGPKSKTLQDAGCFPSGMWMVLPSGITPSQFKNADYDDVQYNRKDGVVESLGKVEFTDPSLRKNTSIKPLPSHVMASVTRRFDIEDEMFQAQAEQARVSRLVNQQHLRKRQQERVAKLDRRIQQLEQQSSEKNKKVSDQVRRMLVKSRATGDKRLKLQDRLYFECFLDKGSEKALVREFRFFSPQDTFATIASSFDGPKNNQVNVEVLTKRKVGGKEDYGRFPVAMRVYEAIGEKFLTTDQVDILIIRWYEGDNTDATPSILDKGDYGGNDSIVTQGSSADAEMPDPFAQEDVDLPTHLEGEQIIDKAMAAAIETMDEINSKGKKAKKGSTAATKVRNMQIKSKATGDSKRIQKMEDRFFLEVVQIDSVTRIATSSFRFLANMDPIERVIQNVSASASVTDWEFLVPLEEESMSYTKLQDTSIALRDASEKGILKPFDRLILRPKQHP